MKKLIIITIAIIIILVGLFGMLIDSDLENNGTRNNVIMKENIDNTNNSVKKETPAKDIKAPFEIKTNIDGLKIDITKIEKVNNLLKIYVKYINNTGAVYELAESLHVVVADGKQYENDTLKTLDFIKAPLYELENSVTYESILCFPNIKANKFNLVFSVDYKDIRINNIIIK